MGTQPAIDTMETRIRAGIEKAGFQALFKEDLAKFWEHNFELSDEEKTQRIKTFAHAAGFQVRVAANLTLAIFTLKEKLV